MKDGYSVDGTGRKWVAPFGVPNWATMCDENGNLRHGVGLQWKDDDWNSRPLVAIIESGGFIVSGPNTGWDPILIGWQGKDA